MSWFFAAVKKYAVFKGRARRKEFWYFTLFYIIFSLIAGIVDALAGTQVPTMGIGLISIIYALAMLLPSVSVSVRRLHDTGRSGWWWWINLLPFIGQIVLLVFVVLNSQPGDNRYGPNPKGVA